jgi:hypothetical protein
MPIWAAISVEAAASKDAVQVALAFMVTVPVVQPEPDQPAKVEPAAGVAVKVTDVPLLKAAEHVLPGQSTGKD